MVEFGVVILRLWLPFVRGNDLFLKRGYLDHSIVFFVGFCEKMDVGVEIVELSLCGVQNWAGTYLHLNKYYKK